HIVRLIIPVGFLTLCLFHMDGFLRTSVAFVPEPLTLLTYGFFFWCGWMLFHQRELLLVFNSHAWLHTLTGLALFGAYKARSGFLYGLDLNAQTLVASFLIASVCWLSVLGLTGLFQRYLDRPSSILRYIVDASYWVYLIHLPAIAFLVGIMYWVGGDWWLKYIFLLLSTLIIGGVSYDLFVRNSLLGVVLNGRKYRRGLPAI
ncbi:MAG: 2,3,4,5-tetrahydropyridine-2,6-carboxylate N-succinyltransferase, partial [Pseudomonadota bacterium]